MPNFLPPPLLLLLFLISASQVSAHCRMKTPPPLDGPAATDATGNAYNSPLSGTGADFPCKGLHLKPSVDKTPKATWAAGSPAFFELVPNGPGGGEGAMAAHSGGSCQASISFDNGGTWKVLRSYQGGCPRGVALNSNIAGPDQKFTFDVPAETQSGDALFSWTWTAVTGNRDEFYMNCAAVKITGSGTSKLEGYDDMFVGDMNLPGRIKTGECRSKAGLALVYPNPGPDVAITTVSGIPFGPPTAGTCYVGPGKGKSTGSGSGDSGQGAGSSSGGAGSGGDGSPVVTKSGSMAVSSSVPSAATSIAQGTGTTTTAPLAGNGNGSGGSALIPTTIAATTPVAGGSGIQTTNPGNGPMFPTTQEVIVPSKTLLTPGSGTKTKTGAGHGGTSASCGGGGNYGSGTGTGSGSSSGSGSGSGSGTGTGSGSGSGSGAGSGSSGSGSGSSGSGSGSGSGAGNTNVGTGAGANTTPATTKPFTNIYTPTTFQTKYTSA